MATPNYIPNGGSPAPATSESLDLCDAILGNSSSLVKYWLTVEKKNPNARPKLPLYDDAPKDSDTGKVDEAERILGELDTYDCTPVHIAIVNAYHNGRMDGVAAKQREAALTILDMLLKHGADTSAVCHHVLFCNVGDLNISSPGAPLDPFGLCLSFKKVAQSQAQKGMVHSEERVDMMDQVMDRLIEARIQETRTPTPTVTIPSLVADTYRDLCGSSLYSDVTIQSNDGHFIPAHRNVLSAASPVWKQLLEDLKKDESSKQENPILSIPRSARVIRTVLEFVYTGQLEEPVLEAETAPLLSVATEYQLDALEQVCAAKCGERLTIHNVRVMLDIGQRHQAQWIQKECLDFLQRQPLPVVLGHPKLVALHKENPLLWEQLLMSVGGYYNEEEIADGEEPASLGSSTTMSAVMKKTMDNNGELPPEAEKEIDESVAAESTASTVRV
mmetsp:Transcript_7690/g.11752  ORF Transcript_7690/g.11752 Transcript_7690/m.11752 type:complete len:445 (+) Transcript_7690:86-1420(+)|eukprot:CAMPEP_0178930150 /NCGR_PEP_ID=MMETSP0786-20121207/21051_1 /TAXON_ID=186022 /ORGANISM="Thalassionema frauenfeldii, Strain CCMP 1798" /LENGTH=444 /DNA_ID=CAMNT_0020606597 /DNA_START=55 /DNA_END=1389 /DNA_ORIENTATION=-